MRRILFLTHMRQFSYQDPAGRICVIFYQEARRVCSSYASI
ncbi:MAG TPA: hypothetical protein PLI57_00895 [Spirochaetota bacterium]|nr:hypothetical protein [Spirochaetota bacterium]